MKTKTNEITIAKVSILDASSMTRSGRSEIASWLREQADSLIKNGSNYTSGYFVGRYLVDRLPGHRKLVRKNRAASALAFHAVPSPGGRWCVRKTGGGRPVKARLSKREAWQMARRLARANGTKAYLHRPDGGIGPNGVFFTAQNNYSEER